MADSTNPPDVKERLKASYDAIASTYNDRFVNSHDNIRLDYLRRLLDLLQTTENGQVHVLELGCGAGLPVTKTLLQNEQPKIHVTANDLSSTQIELARTNLADVDGTFDLVQGDMMGLEFQEASLDAVVAFYSIIHLPRTEQTELVKRIVSWLKPGGLLLANFSQEESDVAITPTWLGEKDGWMFWSGWGEKATLKMVQDAGLDVLVNEISEDAADANFLWVIGKKA